MDAASPIDSVQPREARSRGEAGWDGGRTEVGSLGDEETQDCIFLRDSWSNGTYKSERNIRLNKCGSVSTPENCKWEHN